MSINGAPLRRTTELFQVREGLVWSSMGLIACVLASKKIQPFVVLSQPCLMRKTLRAPGEGPGPRNFPLPGKGLICPNKSRRTISAVQKQGSVKGSSWTTSDGADDLDWFEVRPGTRARAASSLLETLCCQSVLAWVARSMPLHYPCLTQPYRAALHHSKDSNPARASHVRLDRAASSITCDCSCAG